MIEELVFKFLSHNHRHNTMKEFVSCALLTGKVLRNRALFIEMIAHVYTVCTHCSRYQKYAVFHV